METLYKKIIEEIKIIANAREIFSLPSTDEYNVEKSNYNSGGATLYGEKHIIGDQLENIVVTYESKDKCRTFQINPDLNIVTVTWEKNSIIMETFSQSWEDKM
ncbi:MULTISPECIES: hypothetical protein [Flavobacterium]|uniref:hypothetical protein n=1 Tax=Flavobacterium TaxID=237 RepID=UPI00118468F5|nr:MULTISPECIES: hypothetical protein [Flavobacterium]MCR4030426.1 hypothetical protein [Flavobacterium panacis]